MPDIASSVGKFDSIAITKSSEPDSDNSSWPEACQECLKKKPVRTDSRGRAVCARCFGSLIRTIRHPSTYTGRNSKCLCGSGKKYKLCCKLTIK